MAFEILQWWLVVQALGLVGLPLTLFLFRSLPDRGYAFAKTLGLLLVGYGAWLLAMFGLGSFGVPLLLISALLVGGGGLLVLPPARWAPLPWRRILAYEALFGLALIAAACFRATDADFFAPNPNPWFTERPMDFAFFNAIQKSAAFPPQDPWLAGYSINYYYFGYLLMAAVTMLSRVDPAAGYNLALALVFALTALGIAGLIINLIDLTRAQTEEREPGRGRTAWLARGAAALLGAILVLIAGNQAGALQVIVGNHRVVALDGPQLGAAVAQALAGAKEITLPYPAHTSERDFGTYADIPGSFITMERGDRVADFNWWWPSRALWDEYPQRDAAQGAPVVRRYTITEFPFFSFWLGDMHPHVMALPFGLLAMALALATLARPAAPTFGLSRRGGLELALTGIVLGSLYAINSWDLPTYALLYLGALALLYLRLADGRLDAVLWRMLAQQAVMVLLALFVLFAPFHLTFRSLVGAAAPLIDLPLIGGLTRTIAPFAGARSGLHAFLIIFGLFVTPLVAFVYMATSGAARRTADAAAPLPLVARPSPVAFPPATLGALLPWLPLLLLLVGLLLGFPLLALFGLGLFALQRAAQLVAAPAASFVLLVVALGCAICFGTELIFIRDVFGNRMNTIFKFYYQVWLLWGVLASFALWWLLTRTAGARRLGAVAVGGLFLLFFAGALVYPAINLRNVLERGTLVGLAGQTPRENTPAGRESIAWLRASVAPGSVVLEMVGPGGGSYNGEGYAGVSASTGFSTVLGWVGHQQQWRGGDPAALAELGPRQADVDRIYSTLDPEEARALLEQYGVDYIYIGGLERRHYDPAGLAKFAAIARQVYQRDEVTIYKFTSS